MLIPIIIDAISLATSKTDDSMYALDHVQLKEKTLYASNEYSMYYADLPTTDETEYPHISPDNAALNPHPTDAVMLPAATIRKAIANRPKPRECNNLAILSDNIQLAVTKDKIHLSTTDLNNTDTVTTNNKDLEYPDVQTFISNLPDINSQDVRNVHLSISELELLCKISKKAGEDRVTLTVAGPHNLVRITPENKSFTGIIMPNYTGN